MTRYVVIGAGAVGGTIAARLSAAGQDVALVARGAHADAIERDGLRLRTPDGDIVGHPIVWRTPTDAALTVDDVIVLSVKTQDAPEALAPWISLRLDDGRHAGEVLPVLVAMNGVTGERIAQRYARRVYGVCVWTPASYSEPGVVAAHFTPASGVFHIGRVPMTRTDDQDAPFLTDLSRVWTDAGLQTPVHDDVMGWKWRKLLDNVNNAVDALLGDVTDPTEKAVADRLQAAMRAEAEDVITASAITMVSHDVERQARTDGPGFGQIPGMTGGGSSSRQSLTRGTGSIESPYLNGEIALLAHRNGLEAPLNERIVGVSMRAAADGTRPGDWTAPRLAAELGLT